MSGFETALTAVATIGGSVATIATAARLKDRPPIRWLLERLVVSPAEEALERKIDERIVQATAIIGAKVDEILHELHPNSSVSLRDAVDRTEHHVAVVGKKVDRASAEIKNVSTRLSRVEGQVDILARG